ncbi:hypothetical protein [Telluribacter sp. SYSU D00476]|uniref:hypothetical protein n=1 Tax=Telluribacter sp. SYSU D00476 TaxID=2811430 RepID=UPI001FF615E8|nr:hypothetical protein [Telluribacter sp. SYSU D00476]
MNGLKIIQNREPSFMAEIGQTTIGEAENRFAAGHKAYVAYLHGRPAAFGWVATQSARIGELNHEFRLPPNHRYLWNFRTLVAYRGLGIYPHLLRFIMTIELAEAEYLWIMHAPENTASERGILKAGFTLTGQVSVINGSEVLFTTESQSQPLAEVLNTFGFQKSEEQPASCWNCSSPYLKNRTPSCCCAPKNKECTRNLYAQAELVL